MALSGSAFTSASPRAAPDRTMGSEELQAKAQIELPIDLYVDGERGCFKDEMVW